MSKNKRSVEDLALFEGHRAFDRDLHVGAPNLPDRAQVHRYLDEIFDRRWLTNGGPLVQRLEAHLCELLDVKHCILMCNGTVALEIAARALDLSGEVIVPSFTFVASAHALRWQGLRPVFCDVEPDTLLLDPNQVAELITPATTAILGVHLWGRICDVDVLAELAEDKGIHLMFDAAHAFHCSRGGTMVGSFGSVEVFSFHATKFFNTFEGGAVTTNSDELAERMRLMKNFGFVTRDQVDHVGVNGKMTEICAAMGLAGLESLDEVLEVNRRNFFRYQRRLEGLSGVRLLEFDPSDGTNYQYVVIELADHAALNRDELLELLEAEGVLARRYFYPGCHRMEPYSSDVAYENLTLPVTEAACRQVLCLPTGTAVGAADIDVATDLIRFALRHGEDVRGLWENRRSRQLRPGAPGRTK